MYIFILILIILKQQNKKQRVKIFPRVSHRLFREKRNSKHQQRRKKRAEHDSTAPHEREARTDHNTGEQGTAADQTNQREAGHAARQGHRHRNTPPEDDRGQPDPAPRHSTPQASAQHTAAGNSAGHTNSTTQAQQHSTAQQCTDRGAQRNAQQDTPEQPQHRAQ